MNGNDILDIIGDATPDKYVRDAHETKSNRRKRHIFNLAVGAAACLVLAPTVLFGGMWLFFGGMGASAPAPEDSEPAAPAANRPSHYTGPVLPLASLDGSEFITADRSLDISFAPLYDDTDYEPTVTVSDSYILHNSGSEDISLRAVYPVIAGLNELDEKGLLPELLINGQLRSVTVGEVVWGDFIGGFVPVYGAEDDIEMATANLSYPRDFYSYVNLLEDGSYMENSFAEAPELEQKVIVYKLSDYEYTSDTDAPNPTLNFTYNADSNKTTVLTWNFNGGSSFDDEGYYERHTGGIEIRPNASPENIYPEDAYIIVLGDDISNITVQGYSDGSCDDGKELPDLGCSLTKYESSLGEILRELIETEFYFGNSYGGDTDALYRAAAKAIMDFGPIGTKPVTRYKHGMLDEFIYDLSAQSRIAYLSFPITIPAGGSVEIELKSLKALSYNYYGTGESGLYSFEAGTTLGSNLDFTRFTASISDYEGIEIVEGSFGLSTEGGESESLLDLNTDRQWMNIREKAAEK